MKKREGLLGWFHCEDDLLLPIESTTSAFLKPWFLSLSSSFSSCGAPDQWGTTVARRLQEVVNILRFSARVLTLLISVCFSILLSDGKSGPQVSTILLLVAAVLTHKNQLNFLNLHFYDSFLCWVLLMTVL